MITKIEYRGRPRVAVGRNLQEREPTVAAGFGRDPKTAMRYG
jgi:hypothetical protein